MFSLALPLPLSSSPHREDPQERALAHVSGAQDANRQVYHLLVLRHLPHQDLSHSLELEATGDLPLPEHLHSGAQSPRHLLQGLKTVIHIVFREACHHPIILHPHLIDGLPATLPQAPLHLGDEVLEPLAGGVDQLELVLHVTLLGLRGQVGIVVIQGALKVLLLPTLGTPPLR